MPKYKWHIQGASGGTTRTTLIQITPGAGVTVEVTRIFVSRNPTAPADHMCRVELIRMTTASTGGSAGQTATQLHPNDRAGAATVKDSSTAFTFGTPGDILLTRLFNDRGGMEYVPRDDQEKLESAIAKALELVVTQDTAFTVDAEIEWEE